MAKSNKDKDNGDNGTQRLQCELRSGPVAGTALVNGVTFAQKPLQYAVVDGLAIFEGDIVLGTVEEVQADPGMVVESVGVTGAQFRWPNATIPYDFEANFPNPQRVTDAIAHWESKTRIRFVLRTAANQSQFPDFVRFRNGGGCSSSVGKRGGMQFVTLGPDCSKGNAIHEIGHTVGLWHEQSRQDRDTFVRIVWANIAADMQHNFDQHITDGDDLGAYDYGSIMHYPLTAFSTNGQATIVTLQPVPAGVVIGQRISLSAGDIAGVAAMYPSPTIKEVAKDPIVDTLKEGSKDPILDTTKEVRKDPIADGTLKEVRKDPIRDTIKEVGRDPIGRPGFPFPRATLAPGAGGGATPFVMAGQTQYGGQDAGPSDMASQILALGEALQSAQAQLDELGAAYAALAEAFDAGQGQ